MQHCTSPRWSHSLFGGWCWESWTSGQNLKSYTMLSYFIYIGLRGPSLNLHCQSNLLCNCLISTMSRTLGFSIEMYLLNKTSCRHVVAIQLPRVFENHCSPGAACVWSPAGYPTPQSPPGRRRTPRSLVHVWSARHVYASCNWNGILYRIPACQQQRWSQRAVTTPAVHPRFFCQARSTKPPFLAPDLCGGIYIYIYELFYMYRYLYSYCIFICMHGTRIHGLHCHTLGCLLIATCETEDLKTVKFSFQGCHLDAIDDLPARKPSKQPVENKMNPAVWRAQHGDIRTGSQIHFVCQWNRLHFYFFDCSSWKIAIHIF